MWDRVQSYYTDLLNVLLEWPQWQESKNLTKIGIGKMDIDWFIVSKCPQ